MMRCRVVLPLVVMLLAVSGLAAAERLESREDTGIPEAWRSAWQQPPASDRPLQIVHGIPIDAKLSDDQRAAAITDASRRLAGAWFGWHRMQCSLLQLPAVGRGLEDTLEHHRDNAVSGPWWSGSTTKRDIPAARRAG